MGQTARVRKLLSIWKWLRENMILQKEAYSRRGRPNLATQSCVTKRSMNERTCHERFLTCLAALVGAVSLFAMAPVVLAQNAAAPAAPEQTRTISPQSLKAVRSTSQRLIQQSRDSFNRGLIPLVDHLDQVTLAASLNLRLASSQKNRETQLEWHRLQVRHLEEVATQLDRFQQPASAGWEADTLMARLSLAQAQVRLASFEKQAGKAELAQRTAGDLARKHWDQRLRDAQIGHATPMQLWRAAGLVFSSENRSLNADRQYLTQAIQAADRWNLEAPGLSRADLRDALQFELDRVELLAAKPGTNSFRTQAQRAETSSQKLFDTLAQYQTQGTASLYDVATAWHHRQELHVALAENQKDPLPNDWTQRRVADLNRLRRIAAQTTDQRGRIAADLSYVELLSLAENTLLGTTTQ